MIYDVCVVGQIVKDYNFIYNNPKKFVVLPGGSAFYSAISYNSLGLKTCVFTSFNNNDISFLSKSFKNKKITIFNNENATTTEFRNYYSKKDVNYRSQKIIFNNHPVKGKLPKANIYHFGPLVLDDISKDLYHQVKTSPGLKIIDMQGLVRKRKKDKINGVRYRDKYHYFRYFDFLKCDTNELKLIKNFKVKKNIINYLYKKGISEILLTKGIFGSTIYSKKHGKIQIPPFIPNKIVDCTGCGDIYAAIYTFARYKKYSIFHSGLFASAGSGIKTENRGVPNISIKKIKKKINPIYKF